MRIRVSPMQEPRQCKPLAEFPIYQWLIAQGEVELGSERNRNFPCRDDAVT